MRIHTADKDLSEYTVGETIMVDVSYQSSTYKTPARFVEGTIEVDMTKPLKVMVGSGKKVHDAKGLLVNIVDVGKNWNGGHWFGIRPWCQEYRGMGMNWFNVSDSRVVDMGIRSNISPTTCSKCLK